MASVRTLVEEWQGRFTFNAYFNEAHRKWTRRYLGHGAAMQPYSDGDTRANWSLCPAKYCRQFYDGRLWKCAPLAYLRMQHEKLSLGQEWEPYLEYKSLEPGCSEQELKAFLELEEESYCGMCPAYSHPFEIPNPMHARKAVSV